MEIFLVVFFCFLIEANGSMADNDWINGYLEAILDAGERIDHVHYERTAVEASTAAKYFVEEVVGHDESALYNTWIRVSEAY